MKLHTLIKPLGALCILSLGALLNACGGDGTPSTYDKSGHFTQVRTYVSEQPGGGRCATPDGCFAQMTFAPDGSGTIIFSDIANRVNYSIKKDVLTTNLEGQGDIPKTLKFDLLDNARSLVRQDTGTVFNLKTAAIAVYAATGALACEPNTGISISQSAQTLTNAKIPVESSYCGYLANIARPAVCGIPTDKVYVHLVAQDQVAAAQQLGFSLANKDTASQVTQTPCPTN
jgi:hypothetical protein